MSEFEVKPATRTGVKPLVGFYGKTGSGKTLSALYFARGIVGPNGKIGLLDTENKRGSIYADIVPGGYSVVDLDAPFSPERYEAAFKVLEKSVDIIVVDSMSHEWSGEGGVLDMQEQELERMAGQDWNKRERVKMAAWIKPKQAHKHLVGFLLRCKLPLICCLRGEEKTRMLKNAQGKNEVITDEFSSPLFDSRFIFEMLINFETVASKEGMGGFVIPRKVTHPAVRALLPKPTEQIGIAHGTALAVWCSNPTSKAPVAPDSSTPESRKERMFKELTVYGDALLKQFAELKGWLTPLEPVSAWPDSHVPKTKGEMRSLMLEIENLRASGSTQ